MLDQIIEENLLPYFKNAEKPASHWKIGLEQEVLGFDAVSHSRIGYQDKLLPILQGFADQFGWKPYFERGHLIGLKKEGSSITIEPGGQLELSLCPLASLNEIQDKLKEHQSQLARLSQGQGVYWVSMGYDPYSTPEEVLLVPKKRYDIMAKYLPPLGSGAAHMMRLTCTAQSNFDYSSEQDMINKMRIAVAFSPIASIFFATSPLRRSGIAGFKSLRNWTWRALDPNRSGYLDFVFEDDFSYRRYIDYALNVPMMFLERDGSYLDVSGSDFKQFLQKGLLSERFTPADWSVQLGSIFPVARLRNAIETRTCDAGPLPMLLAQSAFWKGLLYSESSQRRGLKLIADQGRECFTKMHEKAYLEGFDCLVKHPQRLELVGQILEIARDGLAEAGESHFLNPLFAIFEQRESISDKLIHCYLSSDSKAIHSLLKEQDLIFA